MIASACNRYKSKSEHPKLFLILPICAQKPRGMRPHQEKDCEQRRDHHAAKGMCGQAGAGAWGGRVSSNHVCKETPDPETLQHIHAIADGVRTGTPRLRECADNGGRCSGIGRAWCGAREKFQPHSDYDRHGKYSYRPFTSRFKYWRRVPAGMLAYMVEKSWVVNGRMCRRSLPNT